MSGPATLSDLQARWRPLAAGAETDRAWALLDDAYDEIVTRVPSVPARLAAGELLASLVVRVQCAMAQRVLANPDGLRSETIGGYSYTRDNAVSAGSLYLDPSELALLLPQPTIAAGDWAGSVCYFP